MRRDLIHVPRYIVTGPSKGAAFADHIDDLLDERTLVVRYLSASARRCLPAVWF